MATVASLPELQGKSARSRYRDPLAASADVDFSKLSSAIKRSRRMLEAYRRHRREAVRQYVGARWSDSGSDRLMPLNLVARYVDITSRALVSREPRAMLSTMNRAMRPAVDAMQAWMNQRVQEMYFAEKLRRFVHDALYCLGVMKVGIAAPHDESLDGYAAASGVPFADCVDLDDFTFDPGTTTFERASFVGHRFRVPYNVVKKLKYFKKAARDRLKPSAPQQFNSDGDETIKNMGRGYETDSEFDHEEMVDLWEIYLPRQRKVVTIGSDEGGAPTGDEGDVLRVVNWFGPECGPYHYLGFGTVPGNPMPKGPVSNLVDMNACINHVYRKLFNQATRQKDFFVSRSGGTEDAARVKETVDGGITSVDDPQSVLPMSTGGPNANNLQFGVHLQDVFNEIGGNLRVLGGGGVQAKTATQENLLNDNASAGVADMSDATACATGKVYRSLGWLWWNHPELVMRSTKSLPGLPEYEITRDLYPATVANPPGGLSRKGRFEDVGLRIDPYSMRYRSPQQRLQFLMGLVQQLAPFMPLLQQQGVMLNSQFLLKKIAEYADEPDVTELFSVGEPPAAQGSGGGEEDPRMPAATSREYTRRSVGQDTEANRGHELMNDLSAAVAGQGDE